MYEHVTVEVDDGTTTSIIEDDVYVPQQDIHYSYDADGNLLTDGRWNYTWDGENRLSGMETTTTVPVAAKREVTFGYDYMSRRSWKRPHTWDAAASSWTAGQRRIFAYDGGNLVGELEKGDVIKSYAWGTDLSGTQQGAGGVGGLLGVSLRLSKMAREHLFPIADANGNVMKLADAQTLAVAAEYEYGPFGELIRMTGARAEANPFSFSTKYQDEESGLLYYGYRYYNAGTGRWLNREPGVM